LFLLREDATLLGELVDWTRRIAPDVAREFYDWQFSFPPTRRFFDDLAASRGLPLSGLRKHLEAAQSGYLIEIFAGATDTQRASQELRPICLLTAKSRTRHIKDQI